MIMLSLVTAWNLSLAVTRFLGGDLSLYGLIKSAGLWKRRSRQAD